MRTKLFFTGILLFLAYLATACTSPQAGSSFATTTLVSSPQPAVTNVQAVLPVSQEAATSTAIPPSSPQVGMQVSATPVPPTGAPGLRPTLIPDEWKRLPVIPDISDATIQIYLRGLELGNNPRAFSKIGDCGSTPAWFLGDFDRGPEFYNLGTYQGLQNIIEQYQGSFERTSLAARSGFNASSLFVAMWSDRTYCNASEAPLECEYRVHRPIIAFIMLGTNDIWHPEEFEPQMRRIIEFSLEKGVIPILSTKADNMEGNGSINASIASLAHEYQIPLWNFWAAAQLLPEGGLQEDQAHLTWGRNFFNDPEALSKAWPVRNLTALQMLNAIWQKVNTSVAP